MIKRIINLITGVHVKVKHGVIMIMIYPLYLILIDYVKHSFLTLIFSITFVFGVIIIMSKGGKIKENEKGEKELVRKQEKPYKIMDLLRIIRNAMNKTSILVIVLTTCILTAKGQVGEVIDIMPYINPIPYTPTGIVEAFPASVPAGAIIVTDPKQSWLEKLKGIEDGLYRINESARGLEIVMFLKQQLIAAREARDKIQKAYDLSEKIRNDLKKLKALKDFSLADAMYLSERVLGESLNPADYMLRTNWKWHEDLKRSFSYEASANLSTDAKTVYNFLTEYTEGEDTRDIRRFDEITDVLGYGEEWKKYEKEQRVTAMLTKRRVYEMMKKNIQKQITLVTSDTLSMDDGTRMKLLLDLEERSSTVEEKIAESNKEYSNMLDEKIEKELNYQIKISKEEERQKTFKTIVLLNYNKSKGFRMVDYRIEKNGTTQLSNRGMFRTR